MITRPRAGRWGSRTIFVIYVAFDLITCLFWRRIQFGAWPPTIMFGAIKRIEAKLDRLTSLIIEQGNKTMADITALTAQVTQSTTVEQSAITLIQGIAAELANIQPTQAAIDALTAQLNTSATALAAAVSANTPAAPAAKGS